MLLSRMPDGAPEIFASIQGEGASMGVPAVFVRLAECNLQCTWCFVPETPILMADWTWNLLGNIRPGDKIIGLHVPDARGKHGKLTDATVTRISRRNAPTVVVNNHLRCTADHKFWLTGQDAKGRAGAVHSGWREVSRAVGLKVLFVTEPVTLNEPAYERGWLAGMSDGDGCFWTLAFRRGYRRFRLALNDVTLLERAQAFAARSGFELRPGIHKTTGFSNRERSMSALWLTSDGSARKYEQWVAEDLDSQSWCAGYLGGILDAEGSHSRGVLRISQHEVNAGTRQRIARTLRVLGLKFTEEEHGFYVRRRHGQSWRALTLAHPAKRSLLSGAFGHHPHANRVIESVAPGEDLEEVITLSTTCGSFVAGGFVVKNCDTKYTWDWDHHVREQEVIEVENDSVLQEIQKHASSVVRTIVFTGGEPLLQQASLARVCSQLRSSGFRIEIETNGAIAPEAELASAVDQWNVSPKLENSGNRKSARLRVGPLTWFSAEPRAFFKFVIANPQDIDEVSAVVRQFGIAHERVLLMPEATDLAQLTSRSQWLVEECRKSGYRLGTRLQVLLWGSKRGT